MVTALFIVLFILQIFSFYIIILLNSKIAKFKDLEKNQERMVREMDDSIGVYLMEMKDENDRLIRELKERKIDIQHVVTPTQPVQLQKHMNKQSETDHTSMPLQLNERKRDQISSIDQDTATEMPNLERILVGAKTVPKAVAANAYKKQNITANNDVPGPVIDEPINEALPTFESEVVKLYKNGFSIEEIARKTQKGKTEIELLIKFHA